MIVVALTILTLVAFAANSLLCRMALGDTLIDPVSFTSFRLVSGALALAPLARSVHEEKAPSNRAEAWVSGAALFTYAVAFSLAYVSLTAGAGALILFGAVQITMISIGVRSGERLGSLQWAGVVTAMGGLVWLVQPGLAAPDPTGALLMFVAGIAWGVYSIRGKGAPAPIAMTSRNFLVAAPLALLVSASALFPVHVVPSGVGLALLSGAVTSGLGYVLWYRVLKSLTTTQASMAQLLTPVLVAFGGVVLLSEPLSVRLVLASLLILGGVALVVMKRASTRRSESETDSQGSTRHGR